MALCNHLKTSTTDSVIQGLFFNSVSTVFKTQFSSTLDKQLASGLLIFAVNIYEMPLFFWVTIGNTANIFTLTSILGDLINKYTL